MTDATELVRTIDLSPWFTGDPAARAALLDDIDAECRRVGFLRISGHGVDQALIDEMLAVTTAFFDLPEGEKQRWIVEDKARNRGYAAYGSEALSYSLGLDTKPDMFEAFNVGVDDIDYSDPYYRAEEHRMFASNVWPDSVPRMREVWVRYFDAVDALAEQLMRVFALALDMPTEYLVERTDRAPSVMRANNYERRAGHPGPEPGQMRMGAHSDYGTCTLLLADQVPGLQIVDPDGRWVDVLPEPGTFLVNLGDLLAEWTNDRWRSTLHRVVPPPANLDGPVRRRSIAFFHEANYDALVTVMPTCVSEEHPARYAPITAGEHLMNKLMGPRLLEKSEADQTALGERVSTVVGD